jgi:enamine deaminase RidA (YjgF/YER057c/UK114 family)
VIRAYDDVPEMPPSLRARGALRDRREETVRAQTWWLYDRIEKILDENGSSLSRVIKIVVYLVQISDATAYSAIHSAVFGDSRPVVSFFVTELLGQPEFKVAIEVLAAASESDAPRAVLPDPLANALIPAASEAIAVDQLVFTSGLAESADRILARGTDELPDELRGSGRLGADWAWLPASTETWDALTRGSRVLRAAGASLSDVVSLQINVLSMSDLPGIDHALRLVFSDSPPAVTVVGVPALPITGSRVEVEMTAALPVSNE